MNKVKITKLDIKNEIKIKHNNDKFLLNINI